MEANTIWGGEGDCEHQWIDISYKRRSSDTPSRINRWNKEVFEKLRRDIPITNTFCQRCGAWYGQLGCEPSLDLYLVHLWQITDELHRILKPTGTLWWNHGDSYNDNKCMFMQNYRFILGLIDNNYRILVEWRAIRKPEGQLEWMLRHPRIQVILRNSVIWHKSNGVPSSVKDRLANKHEPIFLLVKSPKYYFNLDAIRVSQEQSTLKRLQYRVQEFWTDERKTIFTKSPKFNYRVRDVIKKGEQCPQYKLTEIERIALKNGYNPEGICPICNRTWKRHVSPNAKDRKEGLKREFIPCVINYTHSHSRKIEITKGTNPGDVFKLATQALKEKHFASYPEKLIKPFILAGCPENGIVLDPFMGSGTTGVVAKKLNRNYIGIEINPDYIEIANKRITNTSVQIELNLV